MKIHPFIKKMKDGDEKAIIDGLNCQGAIYRFNAICFVSIHKLDKPYFIDKLKELKEDDVYFDGFLVSDFANAALYLLGYESHAIINDNVKRIIDSNFDFMRG